MNMYTNTKKSKKLILVLVLLMLFNFISPKNIMANEEQIIGGTTIGKEDSNYPYTVTGNTKDKGGFFDIGTNFTKLLFLGERAVYALLNDIFCDEDHKFSYKLGPDNQSIEVEVCLSPESIIKGKFLLFNANIFEDIDKNTDASDPQKYYDDGEGKEATVNGRSTLRTTIAGWYYALRNFSIVALLSVLVYVGIRMITSTISQDKAKYKIMFKDWLMAICLLIVMHIIMISVLNISSMVIDAIGTSGGSGSYTSALMAKIGTIVEADAGYTEVEYKGNVYKDVRAISISGTEDNQKIEFYDIGNALAYMLLLLVIIAYTVIFAVKYLKREFTIIFLILLGPISCVTYPIDKISDGKAQAFNKWFSEFIYNVIVQPFHLLIYIVLVGSAVDLANDNLVYAIICFAVMIPAEKFVKEMFGFKDSLGSPLGAFAGGALASQLMSKLTKGGGSSGGKSGGGNSDDGGSSEMPVKVKSTKLPGQEDSDNNTVRTNDNPQLNQPTDESIDSVDTSDTPQLNEPTEEGSDADNIDITDTPELNEPEEENGDNDTVNTTDAPELDEDGNNDETAENGNQEENSQGRFAKGFAAVRDKYNRRVLKNNGKAGFLTKDLAKKRAWRATKGVGKFAGRTIKRAVTIGAGAAGALALGTVGFMMGQGSKGALAGAALGAKAGNALGKVGDKVASKTGDYVGTFYEAASGKDKNKEKYMTNQNNIDMARRNFKERNGYKGSGQEIQQELENMYHMKEHGVQDSQMEDAMNQYYDNIKSIEDGGKGMSDTVGMNTAIQSALMAQDYTRKDFNDPKKMQEAYNGLLKQYEAAGITGDAADQYIRNIMNGAGEMKGVNKIALPDNNQTLDLPITQRLPIASSLGVEHSNLSDDQIERMNNITLRLHDKGFTDVEINNIAASCADARMTSDGVIEKYAVKLEYLSDSKTQQSAQNILGSNATKEQIRTESLEMSHLMDEFNLTADQAEAVRKQEIKLDSTTVNMARSLAKESKSDGKTKVDFAQIESAKGDLISELKKKGYSEKQATTEAGKLERTTEKLMRGKK